jgi:hypothetical protein
MTSKNTHIENLILENFFKTFNKIKRIDEKELPDWLKNMTDEDRNFLEDVKLKTPNLYVKFLNIVKNKGPEEAKKEYQNFDPVFLKKQEKEIKSLQNKKIRKEKIEELKKLFPTKQEIKNIIERNFLTADFRYISEKLLLPQLSVNAIDAKITNLGKDFVALEYVLSGVKIFNNIKQLDATIAKGINDDVIMDGILKTIKNFKTKKKYEKQFGKDFDNDYWYFDNSLKIYSKLKIRIEIQKSYTNRISISIYFNTDSSLGPESPNKIFYVNDFDSIRFPNNQSIISKEDVIYLLVNVLVKLHSKINTDALITNLLKFIYK